MSRGAQYVDLVPSYWKWGAISLALDPGDNAPWLWLRVLLAALWAWSILLLVGAIYGAKPWRGIPSPMSITIPAQEEQ